MIRNSKIGLRMLMAVAMVISLFLFRFAGDIFRAPFQPTASGAELVSVGFPALLAVVSLILGIRAENRLQKWLWFSAALISIWDSIIEFLVLQGHEHDFDLTSLLAPTGYLLGALVLAALVFRPATWNAWRRKR
jgi:hypothetical protein